MGTAGIKIKNVAHLGELLRNPSLGIKRAYLFGSRARGDFLLDSDWDILVVSPGFAGIPFPERANFLLDKLPLRRVEAFCYTEEEFKEKSKEIGIVREAVKGKRIV